MKKRKRLRLLLLMIPILFIACAKPVYNTVNRVIYPLRYEEYIEKYSYENSLDKYLVMALIKAESNYIFDAHSGIAIGLMQITEDTAKWISDKINIEYNEKTLLEPETNIKMGCYYLRYLMDYYNGSTELALAAYNAGMGNVNKWLSDTKYSESGDVLDSIPFSETEKYVEKIEKYQTIYKVLYKNY